MAISSTKPHPLAAIPENKPVHMLNLIRFHREAQYPPNSQHKPSGPPLSGSQAYFEHYVPAFRKVAAKYGNKSNLVYVGDAVANVVADVDDQEEWDVVILARYESKAAFRDVVGSKEYNQLAGPHREAATAKLKLIATVERDGAGGSKL